MSARPAWLPIVKIVLLFLLLLLRTYTLGYDSGFDDATAIWRKP